MARNTKKDAYNKRMRVESVAMLNEILNTQGLKAKRAVIRKFNPHFYLMFHEGVKRYEEQSGGEQGLASTFAQSGEKVSEQFGVERIRTTGEENHGLQV